MREKNYLILSPEMTAKWAISITIPRSFFTFKYLGFFVVKMTACACYDL